MQSPALRSVLEDIFTVRRVQTVAEVFSLCLQLARAFRGSPPPAAPPPPPAASQPLLDDAALCKPVRRYSLS